MPNISSLTMPDGIVYSIKDSIARKDIEDIKKNGSGSGGSGSSGGGEPFIVEIEGFGTEQGSSTTAVFADAKAAFFTGRAIIFSFSFGGVLQKTCATTYVDYGGGKERLIAYLGGNATIPWNSDGTFSED